MTLATEAFPVYSPPVAATVAESDELRTQGTAVNFVHIFCSCTIFLNQNAAVLVITQTIVVLKY